MDRPIPNTVDINYHLLQEHPEAIQTALKKLKVKDNPAVVVLTQEDYIDISRYIHALENCLRSLDVDINTVPDEIKMFSSGVDRDLLDAQPDEIFIALYSRVFDDQDIFSRTSSVEKDHVVEEMKGVISAPTAVQATEVIEWWGIWENALDTLADVTTVRSEYKSLMSPVVVE